MSANWNLPPGVSVFDFQVGGARSEWEAEEECPHCGWVGPMVHEEHPQIGVWAWCNNPEKVEVYSTRHVETGELMYGIGLCRLVKEGFEIEPQDPEWEPEPDYGDWRGPDV